MLAHVRHPFPGQEVYTGSFHALLPSERNLRDPVCLPRHVAGCLGKCPGAGDSKSSTLEERRKSGMKVEEEEYQPKVFQGVTSREVETMRVNPLKGYSIVFFILTMRSLTLWHL